MKIFLKCSFKSSRGFRIGEYDPQTRKLSFVSEKDSVIRERMSKEPAKLLQIQLGRSMVLAADETGALFTAVLGLVEGDYDKYVNAVFIGETPMETMGIFLYFCRNYQEANQALMDCVFRLPEPKGELEFGVNKIRMASFLESAAGQVYSERIKGLPAPKALAAPGPRTLTPSAAYAFITSETYADYRQKLSEIFQEPPAACYENIGSDMSVIELEKNPGINVGLLIVLILAMIAVVLAVIYGMFFLDWKSADTELVLQDLLFLTS